MHIKSPSFYYNLTRVKVFRVLSFMCNNLFRNKIIKFLSHFDSKVCLHRFSSINMKYVGASCDQRSKLVATTLLRIKSSN